MPLTRFFTLLLQHTVLALVAFVLFCVLSERFFPASVLPYAPVFPLVALAAVGLLAIPRGTRSSRWWVVGWLPVVIGSVGYIVVAYDGRTRVLFLIGSLIACVIGMVLVRGEQE